MRYIKGKGRGDREWAYEIGEYKRQTKKEEIENEKTERGGTVRVRGKGKRKGR